MPSPDLNRRPYTRRPTTAQQLPLETTDAREQQPAEFHETLAPAVPGHTYRSEVTPAPRTSSAAYVVRTIAGVLDVLLAIRFVLALLGANLANNFVNLIFRLTDWLVDPFRTVFHMPATNAGGYVDWAAIIAIVVVSLLAALINRLLRPAQSV